ncbi:MAG TPA: hypothetical protein VJ904_01535 [Tichowtungia sp.]|nr:hypothetical protein [Tichowtungia sp.]
MTTATDKELKELREEFASLKSDVSEIGKTLSQLASSAANEGRERVRDVAEEGRDRIRNAANQSREQARQSWNAFEKEVEERPMTSLAVALGLGFILGKLLDR